MEPIILVTGATGFVGSHLVNYLRKKGHHVIASSRMDYGDLNGKTAWEGLLKGVTHVVHCAAAVHNPNGELRWFQTVNVDATLNLAKQSEAAGVSRLVFLSSVKVMGEGRDAPYTETDKPSPEGGYAVSKLQTEQGLLAMPHLKVSILRPPLVYGAGVSANFYALMKLVSRNIPLPFGAIRNQRSLIYVENLCAAIEACLFHPNAVGKPFLVSDGVPVSTPELIRAMAQALHKPAMLIPVPQSVFECAGRLFRKQAAVQRMCGSLAVDDRLIRRELDFTPPYTMHQGLTQTANWFMN